MKHSKKITVDDIVYSTTQYSTTYGLKMMTRLGKHLSEPLSIMFDANQDAEVNNGFMFKALSSLFMNLEEEQIVPLVNAILKTTEVEKNGRFGQIAFDIDFAGRYMHLINLLKEILQFQYSDFFDGLAAVNVEGVSEPVSQTTIKAKK